MDTSMFPGYSWLDFMFTVIGVCTYVFDVGSDLWLAQEFFRRGEIFWFGLLIGFMLLSSLIVQMFSWFWLKYDLQLQSFQTTHKHMILFGSTRCLRLTCFLHVLQLGFFFRHVSAIWQGFCVWWRGEPGSEYATYLTHDLSLLRLIETFCESSPQLSLMIYILIHNNHATIIQFPVGLSLIENISHQEAEIIYISQMDGCTMRSTRVALFILVVAMSGSPVGSVNSKAAPKTSLYRLMVNINNRIFNNSLLKPNSTEYKTLFSQVNSSLNSIYNCSFCSTNSSNQKVSAMRFSNLSGTVQVEALIEFPKVNADVLKDLLKNATDRTGKIKDLKINSVFTKGVSLGKSEENKKTMKYEFIIDIISVTYNDSLSNSKSADSEILVSQVNGALYSVYGCNTCQTHKIYQGVSAMTFSDHAGSVLVKGALVFQSNQHQLNASAIREMFLNAIAGGNKINNLKFNPEFIQVISGSTPSTSTSTTATTRPTITTNHPSSMTTTNPVTRSTTLSTIHPTSTNTAHPTSKNTAHPTSTNTAHPTSTNTTHPTSTNTAHPTSTNTVRPTTTTSTTHPSTHPTTHPTIIITTHNAATSFFYQTPITLNSFLFHIVSFTVFFLTSYSF
ncbi:XK-related protein 8 [Silurus asotus]|uniref:XK-related protein n=1 Tax=Silurus asotus TaxID=30991 RepID=A0AAD5ATB6_SILAS|nr:XK-related protein 8 [Silurus asotus]